MYDYEGDFSHWQKQLDDADIDYDVTNLAGATYKEIDNFVKNLISSHEKEGKQKVNSNQEIIEYRPSINEIIVVEQLPVIREQLELMREDIKQDVESALALDVTEETVKKIKKIRSKLTKDFQILETARKEVKSKILLPYEQFEKIYKDCVSNIYKPADEKLKLKIDTVENELKKAKKLEIQIYFNEYCLSKNIDFVVFDQANISVTGTASKKSLKAQAKAFLDKICEELEFVSSQEHTAEILVEYKKSLNAVQAMTVVANRHKALEAERLRIEQARQREAQQAEIIQKVEQVVVEEKLVNDKPSVHMVEPLQAPTVNYTSGNLAEPIENNIIAKFKITHTKVELTNILDFILNEKYNFEEILIKKKDVTDYEFYTTDFKVSGTKKKLIVLRKFLLEGGYDFE